MDSKIRNSGIIFEPLQDKDWIFGGFSSATNKVIFEDGHGWLKYQRPEETQRNANFDTYSCVTFSCLKALSYYFKVTYNIDIDFSERFTAVMSGTTPGQGNSIRNVLESIRKDGFLLDEDCPFTENMTEDEFFAPIPKKLIDKAKNNLKTFMGGVIIEWECVYNNPFNSGLVDHSDIKEALKYAPVITTGFAWSGGPIYQSTGQPNHCFLGVDYADEPEWDVMADDNYPFDWQLGEQPNANYLKKLSTNYKLFSAYKITAQLVSPKKSLINKLFNKMFTNLKGYMDDHGLHVFYIDNRGKQEIPLTTIAERALFMSYLKQGIIPTTNWPAIKAIADFKFF